MIATDRRALAALTLGHVCSDLCQGAVPALIPFLIAERGYGYAAVSALVLVMTVMSSITQPLFGHLADRRPVAALMPLGVLVGGVGIAATGLVSSYALMLAAVAVSGLGVAAFHPEGARYASHASGERAATGMSVFAVGGNAGFALGPLLVTPLVLVLGLAGTAWLAVLPAVAALVLAVQGRRFRRAGAEAAADTAPDQWGPFARLAAVAAGRSGVYAGLQTFIALYFIEQLGASAATGNAALTVMVVAGALGTLAGGRLADRFGRRTIVVGFLATLTPLLALLLIADTPLAFPLLALIGFFCVGNFTVTVVMGQELLPGRVGIASGVTLGAAIGTGGLIAAALGVLADHAGLVAVMVAITALPLPTLALALTLPSVEAGRQPAVRKRAVDEQARPRAKLEHGGAGVGR